MNDRAWTRGNDIELLENGEAFFPRVFDDIAAARREVLIETFIWFDDQIGRQLRDALIAAAGRGVDVDITVDGYGSAALDKDFITGLTDAGVRLHVFGPLPPVMGMQPNLFRRLHRKLVAIDQRIAYVGGINYSDEHMRYYGDKSKQDYAVRVTGPVVDDIHTFCRSTIGAEQRHRRRNLRGLLRWLPRGWARPDQGAQVLFVTRDNHNQRTAIEAMYRLGLRSAQRDIILMNAYFFPGYRFLRAMRQAVQRGVRVRLVLQGEPDKDYVKFAAGTLYDHLLKIGVEVYEFMERPSHAKVAVMDDDWATVGSSNLDPFSLSLNLEANLFIRDPAFTETLRQRLEALLDAHGRRVTRDEVARRSPLWHLWRWMGYHLLRHFPKLAGLIPVRAPRIATVTDGHTDLRDGPGERRVGHSRSVARTISPDGSDGDSETGAAHPSADR